MHKILITGANGYIGSALYQYLKSNLKFSINLSVRNKLNNKFVNEKVFYTGDINSNTNWKKALIDIDCIVHCAGLAHNMKTNKKKISDAYKTVNVDGTINLAKQAVSLGVKRFIFLSSIKVNGEFTNKKNTKSVFRYNDLPNPQDLYAISKYKAENKLLEIASQTNLQVVIIRLPLVYGFGAKGNLRRLINLIKFKIPLPFEGINNKRSLIGIQNLLEILTLCIVHPKAMGNVFLVSDDHDLSTPDLIRLIASAMNIQLTLFYIPISFLRILLLLIGKKNEISKLLGSLEVDISHTKKTLNWKPSVSVFNGIKNMIKIQ